MSLLSDCLRESGSDVFSTLGASISSGRLLLEVDDDTNEEEDDDKDNNDSDGFSVTGSGSGVVSGGGQLDGLLLLNEFDISGGLVEWGGGLGDLHGWVTVALVSGIIKDEVIDV